MDKRDLLKKLKEQPSNETLLILDLDSTLFNVGPRTQAIAIHFAAQKEFQKKYPEECEKLKNIHVTNKHWGISEPLAELGIRSEIGFFKDIGRHWHTHFFTGDFIKHDQPAKGSKEFLKNILDLNITVYYLTGRNEEFMKAETEKSLNFHGFPIDEPHQLHMKPKKKGMRDTDFKREKVMEFQKEYSNIWLIDNEPVILNDLKKHCPKVNLVFFDTVHSNREKPSEILYKMNGEF